MVTMLRSVREWRESGRRRVVLPQLSSGAVDRLAVLAGVGLIVYGVSLLSRPTAVILAGLLLVAGALWRAR